MYFYPSHISSEALIALQNVGITSHGGEIFVSPEDWPDQQYEESGMSALTIKGVQLSKVEKVYGGRIDAPKTWGSLHGDMVTSGRERHQCSVCGHWMTDKDSASDEREHDRTCKTQYEWVLA